MTNLFIQLTPAIQIPQLGFGTSGLKGAAEEATLHALRTGYRHIDTADIYATHAAVGAALRQSGLPRREVFITTKLWSHSVAAPKVAPAVDRFLEELGTDYIDLLLIHWPTDEADPEETLPAMDAVREAGKIRAIGVSNFDVDLLRRSLATGVPVSNNQIKYNLEERPDDTVEFCGQNGITVTAYSPVKAAGSGKVRKLVDSLAKQYDCSPQQLILAWLLGKGLIPIPRSTQPAHIESNFRAQEIELSAEDLAQLNAS